MSKPRRYQLRKEAVGVVLRDHPWIFRDQLSSAARVFADGEWLSLVNGTNEVIGFGLYEADGAIAIRVLRRGTDRPDAAWLRGRIATALAKRGLGALRLAAPLLAMSATEQARVARGELDEPAIDPAPSLASRTDGLRLIHGESDGIPAVVVDRFGDTLVAQSYARGADALARYAAIALARELDIPNVVLRPAHRRRTASAPTRVLRGAPPPIARFVEDGVEFAVDLEAGQKSGAYLDLRGLRRAIATASLDGAHVLNLFSYSGMLGRAAELAGAAHVTHVDTSAAALAFAAAHHATDPARHTFIDADVFTWLPKHAAETADAPYDLVIVDPPSMTSNKAQVPAVLAGYRKLYRAAASLVRPGGTLIAACCTSRVERALFHATVGDTLGPGYLRERELPSEPDHPVGFAQADYLKVGWWKRR